MRLAHGFVENLADKFAPFEEAAASESAIASHLLELRRRGLLQISSNAARAPDGNGDSISTVMNRLNILAEKSLRGNEEGLSADMQVGVLRNRRKEVSAQIRDLRELANLLEQKIPRYEKKFTRQLPKD